MKSRGHIFKKTNHIQLSYDPCIIRFCLILSFMREASFSSVLAVPIFRSIGGKAFLTRRCSGLTHKAASTAELIR
jgi:hypothetical protein